MKLLGAASSPGSKTLFTSGENTMTPIHLTPGQPQVIPLWAANNLDTAGLDWSQPEEATQLPDGLPVVRNVSVPTLTAYLPDPAIATGTAVIVCPGGAFHFLAYEHEGTQVAEWLNARGIAAFMLKYRVVQTGDNFPQCIGENMSDEQKWKAMVKTLTPLVTSDGCQAIRLVREQAAEWGIAPERIGILGFSAGGAVTFLTALNYDASSRPNFAAPIYSAPPDPLTIPADVPPLFVLCAADDDWASKGCISSYAAWRAAGHSAELHIFSQGGHGFGMKQLGLPSDHWIERFADWLQARGFLPQ
jgi:acetyl esterase/lipase